MVSKATNSSNRTLSLVEKLREQSAIFRMRVRGLLHPGDFEELFRGFAEYDSLLESYSGKSLEGARVLEIGYGARPNRLLALTSIGVAAFGVDLDQPVLHGRPMEFWRIYQKNGLERAFKSLVRHYVFDRFERWHLNAALRRRGKSLRIFDDRFLVGDAADLDLVADSLDLIFSEDVFEHIPRASLERLVSRMGCWLVADGLCLISINCYPGIAGGHLAEWFPHRVEEDITRASEPWEHLRKNRFRSDTFLNKLFRREYRELLAGHFDILAELVRYPDLGRRYLTAEVREALKQYPEDELFSSSILFVLRHRVQMPNNLT